jgi:hypothetical protein
MLAALKVAWYVRGVIAAFGLVALLDQLKILPEGYLKIVHAFGAYWHHWMKAVTSWLNLHLPVEISPMEGTWILLLSVIVLPFAIGKLIDELNPDDGLRDYVLIAFRVAGLVCVFGAPLFEFDMFSLFEPDGSLRKGLDLFFATAWVASALSVVALMNPFDDPVAPSEVVLAEAINTWAMMLTIGSGGLAFAVSYVFLLGVEEPDRVLVWPQIASVLGWVSFVAGVVWLLSYATAYSMRMWKLAKGYMKAIVYTFTFFVTLEALYLAPIVQDWTGPFFNQIPET